MSQHGRYQFHMGCGEPLRSQWSNPLVIPAASSAKPAAKRRPMGKGNQRSGRKA